MQGKILIIGKGYIGNYFARYLQSQNSKFEHIARADLDYTNYSLLFNYLKAGGYLACVNCTGYTGRPNVDAAEQEKEKCQLLNVDVPINIYDVCEKLGIKYYHISSGCIYTGYDKLWTEEDAPNFGIDNPSASWYSKTKHMAEVALAPGPNYCIRVRMPFCGELIDGKFGERDLLNKLNGYDKLVNALNSKTHVVQLCEFLYDLICQTVLTYNDKHEVFNYCCVDPLDTKTITDILTLVGQNNPAWEFVDWEDLDIVANRSNCILSMQKVTDCGFKVYSELETLTSSLGI